MVILRLLSVLALPVTRATGCRAAIAVFAAIASLVTVRSLYAEQVGMDRITAAWKARESRIRTATFRWTGSLTLEKGYKSDRPGTLPDTPPVPPRDVTLECHGYLAVAGNRFRFEREGTRWSSIKGEVVPNTEINTFDGKVDILHGRVNMPYPPDARIMHREKGSETSSVGVLAPLLYMKGTEELRREWSDFTVLPEQSRVGDRPCLLLRTGEAALWVDAQRDFLPLRFVRGSMQVTMSYQRDAKHGYVLSGWQCDFRASHAIASVIEYAINPTLPADHFTIREFPPGTWVTDMRGKTQIEWIVRKDGTRRVILPSERKVPYEQLIEHEDPGSAVSAPGWSWMAIANAIVCLSLGTGIVVVWLVRRRSRRGA